MGRLKGRELRSPLQRVAPRIKPASASSSEAGRASWRKWYSSARWSRLRVEILKRDGWVCQATGVALVGGKHAPDSAVIDHKTPHRGDPALFWDPENLQAVCKSWHDAEKQRLEKNGLA